MWRDDAKVDSKRLGSKHAEMAKLTEKIGRVTRASVLKCTGKDWDSWIAILDRAGARQWTHKEIVAFLKKKHRLSPWWQQGVTGGYEIAIGRKIEGRNEKGEYSVVGSRTFPLNAKVMWQLAASSEGLAAWLKPLSDFDLKPGNVFETQTGAYGEVRTMKAGSRVRLKWQDPDWAKSSILQLFVVPRPNGKCILGFQHEQLQNARVKEQMREYWKSALDELFDLALTVRPKRSAK